ncbi:tetratricopeptide (TPR) repeat protein [Methanocalculus alkaliphilus]|uniref:tetratricopeptide repeat protein n=1 Tax=Methanocalculus alkaliphilus TaxID=768730 RepID=UPI00209E40B1|nr:tetratricopeptide repeat protein [Methanocalculus alkaliphilus]MCP1715461.1 tetratricopeptide (TPR) repeat protein [Methanocalculus alkaliphilus]
MERGDTALQTGQYEEAIRIYGEILAKRPDHAGLWLRKASALVALDRYEEALEAYDRAGTIHPLDPAVWIGKAMVLDEIGRHDEAAASLARAEEIDPDHPYLQQAKQVLSPMESDPDDPDALIREGLTHHRRREFTEALSAFEKELSIRKNKRAALLRCDTLIKVRRYTDAVAATSEGRRIWPDEPGFLQICGAALTELERYEEAIPILAKSIEEGSRSGYAWHYQGRALMGAGRHEEALGSFDTALTLTPENSNTWFYRSFVLRTLGRRDEATASLREAERLDPENIRLTLSRYMQMIAEKGKLV